MFGEFLNYYFKDRGFMFIVGVGVGVAAGTILGLFVWERVDQLHWNRSTRERFYAKLSSNNKDKRRQKN